MERNVDHDRERLESKDVDNASRTQVTEAQMKREEAQKEVTGMRPRLRDGMDSKVPKFVPRDSPGDIIGVASFMNFLSVLDSSVTATAEDGASDWPGREMTVRGECVWSELPEEILHLILRALPPAAHCRFRSVCKSWKNFLSSEPDWLYWKRTGTPYSIVTTGTGKFHEIRAFCHSDEKCLTLPQSIISKLESSRPSSRPNSYSFYEDCFEVVDVDKGIFCCYGIVNERQCLAVCNPLTGCTKYAYLEEQPGREPPLTDLKVRLLVDRAKKNFQIVCAEPYLRIFGVFQSWHVDRHGDWAYQPYLRFPDTADDMFLWKNVTYAYSNKSTKSDVLFAFDLKSLDSGGDVSWDRTCVKFPGKGSRFIVSDRDQVMLVRFNLGKRPYLEVWKLRDNGTSHDHRPDFSLSMWENLRVGQKIAAIREVKKRHLVNVCCGPGHMCFIFRAGVGKDSVKGVVMEPDVCVKYSFVTGRSSVIACPAQWRTFQKVFSWEPDPDVEFFHVEEDELEP